MRRDKIQDVAIKHLCSDSGRHHKVINLKLPLTWTFSSCVPSFLSFLLSSLCTCEQWKKSTTFIVRLCSCEKQQIAIETSMLKIAKAFSKSFQKVCWQNFSFGIKFPFSQVFKSFFISINEKNFPCWIESSGLINHNKAKHNSRKFQKESTQMMKL